MDGTAGVNGTMPSFPKTGLLGVDNTFIAMIIAYTYVEEITLYYVKGKSSPLRTPQIEWHQSYRYAFCRMIQVAVTQSGKRCFLTLSCFIREYYSSRNK
uniref:Transposase n=1 Tax=Heterorhabditis bacteriophora TaxID=37862 RepID=A0A1I7XDT9_HETBA